MNMGQLIGKVNVFVEQNDILQVGKEHTKKTGALNEYSGDLLTENSQHVSGNKLSGKKKSRRMYL